MIRTYRPRIDTLQQFPAISVSVTSSRPSSLRANVPIFSLASRGAKFRDATYYTTYRNVSVYSKTRIIADYQPTGTASHNFRY